MAKKSSQIELPKWATNLWKELGSPDLDSIQGITSGDLLERRNGLRRDDIVEIQIDARAFLTDSEQWIRGRLISSGDRKSVV